MNGGYSQDYQRGPPPQQRYPQGGYHARPNPQQPPQGRAYDHRPPPQRPHYPTQRPAPRPPPPPHPAQQRLHESQQREPYNNYNGGYNNNNDQYAYNDNRHYEEQYQYDQQPNQYEYQDYGRPDDRQYQYDDRYRANAERPPPQQYYNDAPGPQRINQPAHASADSRAKPKERERILQSGPESPKSVPWDNPFGAFPGKKSENSDRQSTEAQERVHSSASQSQSDGRRSHSRPSTSQEQRQYPSSSTHRRGDSNPTQGFPPRKELPRHTPQERYHEEERQYRPPQRAMTGPIPQLVSNGHDMQHPGMVRQHTYNGYPHDQPPHHDQYLEDSSMRYDVSQQPYAHARGPSVDAVPSSMLTQYERQNSSGFVPHPQPVNGRDFTREPGTLSTHAQVPSQEIPNFDAITTNTNEDQLSSQQPLPPIQPYRKPTYQSSAPIPPAKADQTHASDELISPLASFSFDLPAEGASAASQHMSRQEQSTNYLPDVYQQPKSPTEPTVQTTMSQFPPRSASRGNMRPPPRDPSVLPPLPPQQGYPQSSQYQGGGSRPDTRSGQGPASQQLNNYAGPPPPSNEQYPIPRDQSRGGYDPRLQPERNGTPSSYRQYQEPPSRPMTSNSGRPPVNGPGRSLSSDSTQASIRSQTDPSSRPVPFRAGLMQPPPQAPSPANQPQRQMQAPDPTLPRNSTVTIQELNELRQSYQNQPEDHALGLRFAKRLVEAAKVLPNQNGSTDPKQTVKNRERYILDAHKIVKKLIQSGYTEAMFYMADCYGQGSLGLQPDPREAFSLYQSAAKLGHAQAAYRVAVCCEIGPEEGGGTRRDPLKAVQWYKRAASLGDAPAMYKMGMVLLKGLLGQPRNPREAISWLKRAAERADAENPHALHELALLYESAQSTDIVLRDEKYALQLFTQAADLGYKYSQFRLGSAYEYGKIGCPIDPRLSIGWYSKAAAQGEHQSEFALSGWYLTGSGSAIPGQPPLLEQSDTEAYLWARKAAGSGLPKAEYAMGYYTETGIGTAVNVEEAKKWYFRAAAQNHPKARERLEELKRGGARMQKTRVSRSNVGKHNEGECSVM